MVSKLHIRRAGAGRYDFQVAHGGVELFADGGFNSISECLLAAADVSGIDGYEVTYGGLSVGAYRLDSIRACSEDIAQRAVDTVASFAQV